MSENPLLSYYTVLDVRIISRFWVYLLSVKRWYVNGFVCAFMTTAFQYVSGAHQFNVMPENMSRPRTCAKHNTRHSVHCLAFFPEAWWCWRKVVLKISVRYFWWDILILFYRVSGLASRAGQAYYFRVKLILCSSYVLNFLWYRGDIVGLWVLSVMT